MLRLDECPPGLVLVAAHGQISGGLAWKHESGAVSDIAATDWLIPATAAICFEGVPMTAVPATASTDPRIDEIRERLDKATPGPWEAGVDGDRMNPVVRALDGRVEHTIDYLLTKNGPDQGMNDAKFIANAPDDLAWCIRKIERLSAKLAMVSLIVDDEPDPCPEHPNDDPVTCGWKRDIISIRRILNDTEEN